MQQTHPNDNIILQRLLNKIILFRFTRNLDRELQNRKISHAEISSRTGRSGNWFNRSFNKLEDMQMTTFVKMLASTQKIIQGKQQYEPITIDSIIDSEIIEISSVSIDLSIIDIEKTLASDHELADVFLKLKVYVDSMRSYTGILSAEELEVYDRLFHQVSQKES